MTMVLSKEVVININNSTCSHVLKALDQWPTSQTCLIQQLVISSTIDYFNTFDSKYWSVLLFGSSGPKKLEKPPTPRLF